MNFKKIKKTVLLFMIVVSGVLFLLGSSSKNSRPTVHKQNLTLEERTRYDSLEAQESLVRETIDIIGRQIADKEDELSFYPEYEEGIFGFKHKIEKNIEKRKEIEEEEEKLHQEQNNEELKLQKIRDEMDAIAEKSNETQNDGNNGGDGGDGGQG